MTSAALLQPFLTDDPPGPALSGDQAREALARREQDRAALADLAVHFHTSEGQVARALCAAIKARADAYARRPATAPAEGPPP